MNNIKYQNYLHYKLPITSNPLEYGKLIEQIGNKYIITLTTPTNVAVIKKINNENFVKIFRKGELMFEYKEIKISDIKFIRTISDLRFTFENSKLISTEILTLAANITIFTSELKYEDSNAIIQKSVTPSSIFNKEKLKYYLASGLLFLIFIIYFLSYLLVFLGIFNNIYNFVSGYFTESMAVMSTGNIIKLRKVRSLHKWEDVIFKLNNRVFSKNLVEKYFNEFWNNVSDQFNNNNHMFILFKIKYNNGEYSSIGKIQRINITDLNWYIDFIIANMEFKSEYYNETPITEFIISYGFKNGKIPNKTINTFEYNQKFKGLKIPISMNPSDFGTIVKRIKTDKSIVFIIQNELGQTITLEQIGSNNIVTISKSGKNLIELKDISIADNKFIRTIGNKKYFFTDFKECIIEPFLKTKFIKTINKDPNLTNKFLTLDIETYIKDGVLFPFCISIYDGKEISNFWLTDFNNVEELVISALQSLLKRKYNGWNVYIHNMAKFDIIFLFKYLVRIANIFPVIHNGKIISIMIQYGDKKTI
jgi:hypothetical protein